MKRMRLAMCVAVFALVGGIAISEDMDIRALQAKLAAQEARLNDLQAKMNTSKNAGVPEGIVSMRKNAVVTIGGTVNTRYFYRQGSLKSNRGAGLGAATPGTPEHVGIVGGAPAVIPAVPGATGINYSNGGLSKIADTKRGDFKVSDAKLAVKIDVNDHFDAYLRADLQDLGRDAVSGLAQYYWIRWKNICNSGFGVLIGRNNLVFGGTMPAGLIESFSKVEDGTTSSIAGPMFGNAANLGGINTYGEGMFMWGNLNPARTVWDQSRTTQITPYWESSDGKWKAEVSFMQNTDYRSQGKNMGYITNGVYHDRTINYGLGTMSARLTAKPIEGLQIIVSALNQRANNRDDVSYFGDDGRRGGTKVVPAYMDSARNNFATNVGFQWRPCFFNKLNIWAEWTHGWNENYVKDMDSDTGAFGLVFDFTNKLSWFGSADFMRIKNDDAIIWHKANGWATYTGLIYKVGYGVTLEAGWRHEEIKYKDRRGSTHTKYKGDTIYGHLGFSF